MAITRTEEFVINLRDLIVTQINTWNVAREGIRAREESLFQTRIQDGMSYQDQLIYREGQLEKEESSNVPDQNFIDEIKTNLTLVKKLIRNKKVRDSYTNSLQAYTTGKSSLENHISKLKSDLNTENDPTMKEFIQEKINEAETLAFNAETTVIKNRADVAVKDKSISLINESISAIENKKSQALLNGRDDLVSTYDVMLSTLKGSRGTIEIENKINNFNWSTTKTDAGAVQKINTLNTLINQSDLTNPIFYNNKKYNSESEFWQMTRDSYANGSGSGLFADFTTELGKEVKTNLAKVSLQNSFGFIPMDYMDSVDKMYKDLMVRPELQPFINKLETQRLDSISTAVAVSAKAISDEASFTLNFDKGMTALQSLSKKYGVDLASEMADLQNKKLTEIAAKVAATQKLAEISGTTYKEEAVKLEEQAKIPEGKSPIEQVIPPVVTTGQTPAQREAAYKAAGIPMPETVSPVPTTIIPKKVVPPITPPVTPPLKPPVTPPIEPSGIITAKIDPITGKLIPGKLGGSVTVSKEGEMKPKTEAKTETKSETWAEIKARKAKESGIKIF